MLSCSVRNARPEPLVALLHPSAMIGNMWSRRDLMRQFAVRYFVSRYRGNHLGVMWAVMFPLIMLAVYTFVFTYVFNGRGAGDAETRPQYAVWLFCGMSVLGVFTSSVVRACGLILENPQFVTRVVFPLEVLPMASLGSSLLHAACEFALVIGGVAVFWREFHWQAVLAPVALLPLVLMSAGVSWVVASLTVYVRDVANVVSLVVSQLLFFLTPIFWKPEQLLTQAPHLSWVIEWNPIAPVVDNVRRCVLFGEMPNWGSWAIGVAAGAATMQLGYAWFMKTRRGFADVI